MQGSGMSGKKLERVKLMKNTDSAKKLIEVLEKYPEAAERFVIDSKTIDILVFEDRPFKGAHSAITHGLSCFEGRNVEIISIYDPKTLSVDTDLNGFIATYLELYVFSEKSDVKCGDLFIRRKSVLNGYDFSGVYLTSPAYFPNEILSEIDGVEYFWMLFLYDSEVDYILTYGGEKFEELLEILDPDLSDFCRKPLL